MPFLVTFFSYSEIHSQNKLACECMTVEWEPWGQGTLILEIGNTLVRSLKPKKRSSLAQGIPELFNFLTVFYTFL